MLNVQIPKVFEALSAEATDQEIACIMNTMRILKKVNPGDAYYEAYQGHVARCRQKSVQFMDTYILMWRIGALLQPKRILEIGSRTGISLCQLLSAYQDLSILQDVVCVDPFMDDFTSPALIHKNLSYLNLSTNGTGSILSEKSDDYFAKTLEAAKGYFDYILVDGDHSKEAAAKDLENAHAVLAPGGIIVFDDISTDPGECALIDVWEAFMQKHDTEYQAWNVSMIGKGVAFAIKKGGE